MRQDRLSQTEALELAERANSMRQNAHPEDAVIKRESSL